MTIWRWEGFSRCDKFPTTPVCHTDPDRPTLSPVGWKERTLFKNRKWVFSRCFTRSLLARASVLLVCSAIRFFRISLCACFAAAAAVSAGDDWSPADRTDRTHSAVLVLRHSVHLLWCRRLLERFLHDSGLCCDLILPVPCAK